jgi:chromosome segregation ATPase
MNTLLTEIIACLAATAFLSLFVGWAIRSAMANKEVEQTNDKWETKTAELEAAHKHDVDTLEDQLQELGTENKQLSAKIDNLDASLRDNEISVHKARADAIELNRQQADTQERLQRIIAQKDEELKILQSQASSATAIGATAAFNTEASLTEEKIATLAAKREAWERERQSLIDSANDEQATVAIDPADLPFDQLDATVKMDADQLEAIKNRASQANADEDDLTQTLDNRDANQPYVMHDPLRAKLNPDNKSANDPLGGQPDPDDTKDS